jgi:hypothetical protein
VAELTRQRRLEILDSLGSTTCEACGGKKSRGKSHCRDCYFLLPPRLRNALYRRFGEGYEEAYEESLKFLNDVERETRC